MRYRLSLILLTGLLLSALLPAPGAAQYCPGLWLPKGSSLYLYFPTTADATFPDYSAYGLSTSPANPFDVADLDASIGTTAQLRDRIFEIVEWDYCEFDVKVQKTTTAPSPAEARWQIVAIGSDSESLGGDAVFGEAQDVDLNDSDVQDYGRVWAKSFKDAYGGTGEALEGTNSTLERWATAIGETTAHEAGHNYGLSHGNSSSVAGEDSVTNHILATGSTLTGEIRASRDRHFSDTSYQILGHNVGLSWKTVNNWDFVNPNSSDAHQLSMRLLSQASTLTISWWFDWPTSPWVNPTITKLSGTQTFKGEVYNKYDLDFSADNTAWTGGSPGVVPPAVDFHIGVAFSETDDYIVYETTLKGSGGADLPLKPRLVGYDAGALDLATGDFAMSLFNPNPAEGPLIIEDLQIQFLPRVADIRTMIRGATLADIAGRPIATLPPPRVPIRDERQQRGERFGVPDTRAVVEGNAIIHVEPIELRDQVTARIAGLAANRHVDFEYDDSDCEPGYKPPQGPTDVEKGEVEYCPDGIALSLFPSTMVYVTATVIDPDAEQWDPASSSFVTGPLETRLFFQAAGFVPDLNDNGIDDLIDIREGTSEDANGNGVVDEVEPKRRGRAWSIHAGAVDPRGILGNAFDGDLTLNLDYVQSIDWHWDWDLRLGLSQFSGKPGVPIDLDVWNLSGNLKYTFNPAAALRVFVNGGLGAYYLDPPGDLEGGYNLGAGLAATLTPTITGELTYNFHETVTSTPDIEFSKLQLGLLFSF